MSNAECSFPKLGEFLELLMNRLKICLLYTSGNTPAGGGEHESLPQGAKSLRSAGEGTQGQGAARGAAQPHVHQMCIRDRYYTRPVRKLHPRKSRQCYNN